jgi:hypothetical protein
MQQLRYTPSPAFIEKTSLFTLSANGTIFAHTPSQERPLRRQRYNARLNVFYTPFSKHAWANNIILSYFHILGENYGCTFLSESGTDFAGLYFVLLVSKEKVNGDDNRFIYPQ